MSCRKFSKYTTSSEVFSRLRARRGRLKILFFIFTFFMAGSLFAFILYGNFFEFGKAVIVTLNTKNRNYFLSLNSEDSMTFIVNTSGCKIPELDPWHTSIIEYVSKLPLTEICDTKIPHWTYVNESTVVINTTAIQQSGHNIRDLNCCYRTIHRREQQVDNYDENADTVVRYSGDCTRMEIITIPTSEYIHVVCRILYLDESPILYKNFHIIALPTSKGLENTIKQWKLTTEDKVVEQILGFRRIHEPKNGNVIERPPNVIIIGIDSTSRLNFRRFMFKTAKLLENIGAHEMMGYTKVGMNTYPNTISFLTGYHEYEMEDLCRYKKETKLDDCPFIWKNFKDANYVTAEVEDSPALTSFNYWKTGFVLQPTDFYSRPAMLAFHQSIPGYPYAVDCIGYEMVDKFLLDYMKNLLKLTNTMKIPMFLMSWLTHLGHDKVNGIQTADEYHYQFLKSLVDDGLLNNSILFFMSDHGYRHGEFRNTLSGWYEDKLPNMWIRLPPNIIDKCPEWENALLQNERRLSSAYDLFHTFVDILQTFSNASDIPPSPMRNGTTLPRKYGQSFFKTFAENRTCAGVGIEESYCACQYPTKMSSDDPILIKAAGEVVKIINNMLPSQCIKFSLSQIEGSARISSSSETTNPFKYVIDFKTKPGDFLFEVTVIHFQNKDTRQDTFQVSGNIERLSKFNTDVSCIHDSFMQLYCYCASQK